LRGFTLIECLVALAILGIGSLIMAEIYANVSSINRMNHQNNSSIAYQMQFVEKKTNTEAMQVKSGQTLPATIPTEGATPPKSTDSTKSIILTRKDSTTGNVISVYSYAVDYYVLMSRDQNNNAAYKYNSSTGKWEKNTDYQTIYEKSSDDPDDASNYNYVLNYKYFTGYSK
jgi:prepilin-type N-terminal cleavage/methylation domain-containing protein